MLKIYLKLAVPKNSENNTKCLVLWDQPLDRRLYTVSRHQVLFRPFAQLSLLLQSARRHLIPLPSVPLSSLDPFALAIILYRPSSVLWGFFFFFFTNTVMTKVCMVAPAVLLEIIFLNPSGLILTKCIYKYIKIHIIAYKKEALCSCELGRHQSSSVVKEFSGACVLATSGVFTRTDRLSFPSRCFSLLPSAQTLHCTGSNISPAFACWRCLGYPIELWILFCTNGRLHLTWMPPPHTRWLMSFHAGPSSRPPVKYQTPSQKLRESLRL